MIKYLKALKSPLFATSDSNKRKIELLWGDRVYLLTERKRNGRYKAKARGVEGYVDAEDLGDESLLEIYFIDVGQGDGILIRTPDNKHILIDGGYKRASKPSGKNAADFVDWKFVKDYGLNKITIDDMIASHCDADHYGGLWDLINPNETDELDADTWKIKRFYHAGVSWWNDKTGEKPKRTNGPVEEGFLTRLLEDEVDAANSLSDPDLELQGEWAKFIECLVDQNVPMKRLSYRPQDGIKTLPGYNGSVKIKILGPVEFKHNGKPAYKDLGSPSENTNGHSITLRLDYGRVRVLLTGDLNAKSQRVLLESHIGNTQEFQADVTKACHHGSDDCSVEFLSHVNAGATVISSGDNETHSHPRPAIVAASAITGFRKIENDRVVTPLVYSTEISRSYKLGNPYEVIASDQSFTDEGSITLKFTETKSGALRPQKKEEILDDLYVVSGIIYGLVNVRTDGNKIVCATLNEGKYKWDIKTFYSRF